MSFIHITKKNIEAEHICCALGAKQYEHAVNEKKQWLAERMEEGLVFYRLDDRAKVFIEYLPAEMAWTPIYAPNYMYINCLWVSGKFKNNGHAKYLLNYCKEDAKRRGMDGIVHIVGKKKLPYLSDKRFFDYMGFEVVDQAEPYFQLVALKWNDQAVTPSFRNELPSCSNNQGITIYHTAQCPFAVGVLEDLRKVAEHRSVPFKTIRISTKEEAQKSPIIWSTFGLFYNGKFVTHEILSPNKFDQLLDKIAK